MIRTDYCSEDGKKTNTNTLPFRGSSQYHTGGVVGGSGGFFLECEDYGRMFDNSFPACVLLKVEISLLSDLRRL